MDSDVLDAISVLHPGGDGSLRYNNSTGVFTYTPPVIPSVALPDDQEFGVTNSRIT